ncbi:MAG: hypothetical protein K2K41_08405 [Ruminiclostridium sp.]|nr:hypothetical protein [Ruminiclostridium sp.]MDE6725215.1 hypothetical protein [Ruminiclostridium sp.]
MNKEMLKVTLKFVMAVIQLVLSAISLAFCVKLLLDVCRSGETDNDPDEKIMFLDF